MGNKKAGVKSEVYPIQIPDIRKILGYFSENAMWQDYLIFVISCNMARRISDILPLTWEYFFYPATGNFRSDLLEIVEQKTDKIANPHINSAVKAAISLYCSKTGCNPSDNCYKNNCFIQTSGSYIGEPITADGYRKGLKKAAAACGITYNVGTHSPRKTFGMITRMLHPNDYDGMELLQTIFNHSDAATTRAYIGITRQKINGYYDDIGTFFDEYVTGEKEYIQPDEKPVITIETADLRKIISDAYNLGMKNSPLENPAEHINAVNSLYERLENLKK